MIFVKKALRDITRNKSRSVPIFFIIFIALFVAALYIQAGENMAYTTDVYTAQTKHGSVWMDTIPIGNAQFNQSIIDSWKTQYSIEGVQTRLFLQGSLYWQNQKYSVDIISYPSSTRASVNDIVTQDGKYFSDYPSIASGTFLELSYMQKYSFAFNDSIPVTISGITGLIPQANMSFTVLGGANSIEYPFSALGYQAAAFGGEALTIMKMSMYVREDYLQAQLFNGTPYFNQIVVKLQQSSDIVPFMQSQRKSSSPIAPYILRVREYPILLRDMLALFIWVAWGLALVILSISLFLIYTMISRFIEEQKPQTGVLKSLGYTNKKLVHYNLLYGIILGVASELIGIISGVVLAILIVTPYFLSVFSYPYVKINYPMEQYIALFCVIFSLIMSTCYLSVRKLKNVSPQEAVRPQIKTQSGIFLKLEFFIQRVLRRRLAPLTKYQLRNFFIKPKSSLIHVMTLFLALMIISIPVLLVSAVTNGSAVAFQSEKWDAQLKLKEYNDFSSTEVTLRAAGIFPGDAHYEPLLSANVKMYVTADEWAPITFTAYLMNTSLKQFGPRPVHFDTNISAAASWDFARKNDIQIGTKYRLIGTNESEIEVVIQEIFIEKYLSGFFIPFSVGQYLLFGNYTSDMTNNILVGAHRQTLNKNQIALLAIVSSVTLYTDLVKQYDDYISTGVPIFIALVIISLMIGIFIIIGIQSIVLAERKNDIAILKAQGVSNATMYKTSLVEVFFLALFGSLGYFAAYAISVWYADFLQTIMSLPMMEVGISGIQYLIVFLLGIFVSLIGQLFSLHAVLKVRIAAITKEKMFG